MTSDVESHPADDDLLAAEYALGVLDAPDRRRVEARAAMDVAFAHDVDAWAERLAPLALAVPVVEPPSRVWSRIEAALPATPADASSAPPTRAVAQSAAPQRQGALWSSLAFWRWLSFGSMGTAFASIIAATFIVENAVEPLFATLVPLGGGPSLVAAAHTGKGQLVISPAGSAADHRVPQLWLIAPGELPRSLGRLDSSRPTRVAIPKDIRRELVERSHLAITLEPPSGAPGNQPSGPVVARGQFERLSH
ncbi:anti-sigma factor [Chelatococcus reniformis]|uniref:Anti-sigma K factor RskA C-terminal domain-containing protein n=1 Tax=Chelatococcus reniformis TaxID=1494448 RepID=A0A916UJ37_9HYPH|nr:anti-sigma factor [Chelatococcus reniformis]GGC74172.1 hypothetical protein GCM10010994_35710 [Chelatococcus reniformis]